MTERTWNDHLLDAIQQAIECTPIANKDTIHYHVWWHWGHVPLEDWYNEDSAFASFDAAWDQVEFLHRHGPVYLAACAGDLTADYEDPDREPCWFTQDRREGR